MSVAMHMNAPPAAAPVTEGVDWREACALEDIPPDCGVAALLVGRQVAIVRVGEGDRVYAVSNYDPFSEAFVIARGIVGDRAGRPKIASPIYKQSFDLETGACLDDASVTLPTYPVRIRDGRVEVGIPT
jgi:nitrite reductase (NADH) small subunit